VTREVLCLQGLATPGFADLGPFRTAVPAVLDVSSDGSGLAEAPGVRLEAVDDVAAAGEWRSVRLTDGRQQLPLRFPVLAPEVSGVAGDARQVAEGVWSLYYPLTSENWSAAAGARPQVVILANGRNLLMEGEPFVTALGEIRTRLGARPVLWVPRVGLPHRLAMLAYLGVDLVDSTEAVLRGATGVFLDPTLGAIPPDGGSANWGCQCGGCQLKGTPGRILHARLAMQREAEFVRAVASAGRLRELVETRQGSEPLLAELLRHADRLLGAQFEQRAPVVGRGTSAYVMRESRRRAEILRFRARLLERYRPPPSKRVLVLVPCSKTKPYRNSRSHRAFARAWQDHPAADRLHIASVTSPLGLVPRELEDVYPARHYDIPVTGTWEEDERTAVIDALRHLLDHGPYLNVVVHLDPDEYGFLREPLGSVRPVVWSVSDYHTTTPRAITGLRDAVTQSLEGVSPTHGGRLVMVREELEALASIQFGPVAAHQLFTAPIRLMGRPWFQRLVEPGGADLATWREERGLFHLTVAGGERLRGDVGSEVEVAPGLDLAGDLFAPGVARASPGLRIGDAVRLVRDGRLLGVGEARLPGPLMTELDHGLAVSVRHRVHALPAVGPTVT
jgi:archaeosine synthase alpha-subunit